MIIHDVVQGTLDWMLLRLGMPTCSQFDKLITPKTLKPSESRHRYRAQLMAEWLRGMPLEWGTSGWMERGGVMEAEARSYYELQRNADTQQVGFIMRDDGKVGGSPDSLVGDDGGLEIKILAAHHHMLQLLGLGNTDHYGQAQGYMYLTNRIWWDVLFYNGELPPQINRYPRDDGYIEAIVPVLNEFINTLDGDKSRFYAAKVGGPAMMYAPLEDEELLQLHRELAEAEAEDFITREYAQVVLAALFEGRWHDARVAREEVRQAVIEGARPSHLDVKKIVRPGAPPHPTYPTGQLQLLGSDADERG